MVGDSRGRGVNQNERRARFSLSMAERYFAMEQERQGLLWARIAARFAAWAVIESRGRNEDQ